jgi:hypothetical protein
MSYTKTRSLLLRIVAMFLALAAFGSIPYFMKRETAAQEREAAAERAVAEVEAAKAPEGTTSVLDGTLQFNDVEKQSREFIGYYHTIKLTAEQEAIKAEVLKAMPAACCRDSSAYTCCCPCNLSKTLWGLSNYVIAQKGANAVQLKEVVDAWVAFTNTNGYTGDACYQGGCERGFYNNGCGGMDESRLAV